MSELRERYWVVREGRSVSILREQLTLAEVSAISATLRELAEEIDREAVLLKNEAEARKAEEVPQ